MTRMFEFFQLEEGAGVAVATFERLPVNAFSYDAYRELAALARHVEGSETIRALILAASPKSRAWIGGADLQELLACDPDTRKQRYAFINETLPHFYHLDRPVIAAINGPAVGVGTSIAAMCDIRVASRTAFFAKPEIDRGLVGGGGTQFLRLGVPAGLVREMIYTARRVGAQEMQAAGFIDHVVEPEQVMDKAMEIARLIASKSLPALKANKICNNAVEGLPWEEAYRLTQDYSAQLTGGLDGKEGIRAFLEKRSVRYHDR